MHRCDGGGGRGTGPHRPRRGSRRRHRAARRSSARRRAPSIEARPGVSMSVIEVSFAGRPLDLDPIDARRPVRPEVDRQDPSVRRNDSSGRPASWSRRRAVAGPVPVPRDEPRAFGGIAGGDRHADTALSNVDLPAFTRPANATRNGSSSRRSTAATAGRACLVSVGLTGQRTVARGTSAAEVRIRLGWAVGHRVRPTWADRRSCPCVG